ncbi:MAG TPA: MBL fold metallo-hydrolase [Anaerolineae bacterium]
MSDSVQFRWLGVAGIELAVNDRVLAVDPFFTRPPFRRMWFGRAHPNRSLIAEKIQRCHFILVTHPHWDHIMDVPDVARNTGATVFGSPNACQLASALGVPDKQIHPIALGDTLSLDEFEIEVLPAQHLKTPIDGLINGPLRRDLRPPLRLFDYRMDACFSFRIRAGAYRVLHGEHPVPADILLAAPLQPRTHFESLLRDVRPHVIIPIHWDDLFRPLSKPIRPMLKPPVWAIPPLQRMEPTEFKKMIEGTAAKTKVFIPEIFRSYSLDDVLRACQAMKQTNHPTNQLTNQPSN